MPHPKGAAFLFVWEIRFLSGWLDRIVGGGAFDAPLPPVFECLRNLLCVHFLCPHKKRTKESGIGEALSDALPRAKAALSYVPLPARIAGGWSGLRPGTAGASRAPPPTSPYRNRYRTVHGRMPYSRPVGIPTQGCWMIALPSGTPLSPGIAGAPPPTMREINIETGFRIGLTTQGCWSTA